MVRSGMEYRQLGLRVARVEAKPPSPPLPGIQSVFSVVGCLIQTGELKRPMVLWEAASYRWIWDLKGALVWLARCGHTDRKVEGLQNLSDAGLNTLTVVWSDVQTQDMLLRRCFS